jgi:hypothetical protein
MRLWWPWLYGAPGGHCPQNRTQAFAEIDAEDFQRTVAAEKIKKKPKRSKFDRHLTEK